MPELPDVVVYVESLRERVVGERLERVSIRGPSLLRTFDPPLEAVEGESVVEVRRIGKRIAFGFGNGRWLVLHLMVAGRLQWKPPGTKPPGRIGLAAFAFTHGTLVLTEAGTKKRASLHVLADESQLAEHDRGGLEVLDASLDEFRERLTSRSHTVKRALCDPTLFSGIGNAYSDEILYRARLSPFVRTKSIDDESVERLYAACRTVLAEWTDRLRAESRDGFPKKVTAFRPEMAVHGKFGEPCPDCGATVQRIRYADNETNYCPRCQTEGRLLADRSLSRLLKDDWPRNIDELDG